MQNLRILYNSLCPGRGEGEEEDGEGHSSSMVWGVRRIQMCFFKPLCVEWKMRGSYFSL